MTNPLQDDEDLCLRVALMKCWEEQQAKEEKDEVILRARRKRAARLRRQNNSTASTRILPIELLSIIFEYACAEETFDRINRRNIFGLGRICSKWRNLVLSMPHLWSRFTLTIYSYSDLKQHDLDLLQHCLDYVRDIPFSLRLLFVRPYRPHQAVFNQIEDVLLQERNALKVQTLRLEFVPWRWIPLFSCLQSVNNIEITNIYPYLWPFTTVSLSNFPRLSRVEFSVIPESIKADFPWTQITSLTLRHMSIDVCISLLIQCPNLLEFHCFSPQRRVEGSQPAQPQVDNPNPERLEHFTWTYGPHPICTLLYPQLRLPSLRTLQWYSHSYRRPFIEPGEASALRSLFTGLSSTLSYLHIQCVGVWPVDLVTYIFSRTPNLRILHLTKCKYIFVVDTFAILNGKDSVRQGISLPLLKKLVIQDPEGPTNMQERELLEAKLASHIIPMFRSRDPDKKKLFSLQLSQTGGLTSKEMRKVYSALRMEGYAFNIWVDFAMTRSIEGVLEHERRKKDVSETPKVGSDYPLIGEDEDWDDEPRLAYSTDSSS